MWKINGINMVSTIIARIKIIHHAFLKFFSYMIELLA